MTRQELIAAMRRVLACRPETAGRALDVVLAEVERQVFPLVEREWKGNEVMHRIRRLKSNPKP